MQAGVAGSHAREATLEKSLEEAHRRIVDLRSEKFALEVSLASVSVAVVVVAAAAAAAATAHCWSASLLVDSCSAAATVTDSA